MGRYQMEKMKYDICIIGGLGHVGLPLGILFANTGKKVMIYDLYEKAIDMVLRGKMPFKEEGAEALLKKVIGKTLFVSSDKEVIKNCKFIIIVIGTPADRHLSPEFALFKKFFDDVIDLISDDQHIILRSTVLPGTTEKMKHYLLMKGKSTRISFCPERIAQGKAIKELRSFPQIIGSFDDASGREAKELFSALSDEILFLQPLEAEMAKLFCNVWRYIQFAIANQFYQLSAANNIDFYKVYNALIYNYPRAHSFEKAGLTAGPCLLKDTAHLVAFSGNSFSLGNAAMLVNEGLPNFIVRRLTDKYSLTDKTVGILGMAFKADVDDRRDSLSYKLKKILEMEAKRVLCSDVYINEEGFIGPDELIADANIIILGCPHSEYSELRIKEDKILVDVWNFYGRGGLF
jgi:UDP-N-acetyl-D-mannosaminuronic acid dehydrogenase